MRLASVILPLWGLCSASCRITGDAAIIDPIENEIRVARDGARSLDARIAVDVGDLEVDAGACPLLVALARYDGQHTEPRVEYWVDEEFRGHVEFTTRSQGQGFGRWKLCLSDAMPTSLNVSQTAGKLDLDLGGLQLEELSVVVKSPQATIDLVGRRYRNTKATLELRASTGHVLLRVPKAVGARVELETTAGTVDTSLARRDGAYVNDAYGNTPVQLEIRIVQHGGDLRIETG